MASSEGSAHSQWRRFFAGAGGAYIFEIIDAAVAVASLDRPAELKQRRERIARRLYTGGVLCCVDEDDNYKDSIAMPVKGRRPMAVSKKEDGPSGSSAEKATAPVEARRSMAVSKKEDGPSARSSAEKGTAPVKNLARMDCPDRPHSTKPLTAAAVRDKARAQPSEQSMEAKLAAAKRKLKERYDECEDAKRQRKIQVVEAPELARSQHFIVRRRDEVRCAATIGERRALMPTLRTGWA